MEGKTQLTAVPTYARHHNLMSGAVGKFGILRLIKKNGDEKATE